MTTSLSTAGPSNMIRTAHPSPQPKRDLDRFSRFFAQTTVDCPYTLQWDAPFPLKIAPAHGGSGPHLIHVPWAHPSPQPKRHLDLLSHFCMGSLL